MAEKRIVALCYDFDKTLSPRDMQEYGYISSLDMTAEEFWSKSARLVRNGMDDILAYMYTMIDEARKQWKEVTYDELFSLGKNIELFNGVSEWFDAVNALGEKCGLTVEHYIISSGIKEIIEGTEIAKYFKAIYASSFHYDENGYAVWPAQAVNFTTKTQYLFAINKNASGDSVNDFVPDSDRRIPFSHFIYLGDSATDIPCMRLVKSNGGRSIGIYNVDNSRALTTVKRLIRDGRINYYADADYSTDGNLMGIVERIFNDIKIGDELAEITKRQLNN